MSMKEDFLHYLWKHKKFDFKNLITINDEPIVIQNVGEHNENSGPDFFNAQLNIDGQKWAGNVEIHIKSSDWYAHHHEKDPSYDNVILHVVWDHDIDVFRKNNTEIPTLQIKDFINEVSLVNYKKLFDNRSSKWINCEKELPTVSAFTVANWQERLYFERVNDKSIVIEKLLHDTANDWEAVLFKMLARNFGLKINADSFFSIANSIDYKVVHKCSRDVKQLEALFFGQANLLQTMSQEPYVDELKKEYSFLCKKFDLNTNGVIPVQFFRLRPSNFPTIRLSQLVMLYHKTPKLFTAIISSGEIQDIYDVFSVSTSDFWKTHYTFDKSSTTKVKKLTKSFIDLIIINTIIPIRFLYAKQNNDQLEEDVFSLITKIKPEKNSITDRFKLLHVDVENALHSQSLIQLKNNYCDSLSCLQCGIGNYLLNQK